MCCWILQNHLCIANYVRLIFSHFCPNNLIICSSGTVLTLPLQQVPPPLPQQPFPLPHRQPPHHHRPGHHHLHYHRLIPAHLHPQQVSSLPLLRPASCCLLPHLPSPQGPPALPRMGTALVPVNPMAYTPMSAAAARDSSTAAPSPAVSKQPTLPALPAPSTARYTTTATGKTTLSVLLPPRPFNRALLRHLAYPLPRFLHHLRFPHLPLQAPPALRKTVLAPAPGNPRAGTQMLVADARASSTAVRWLLACRQATLPALQERSTARCKTIVTGSKM